MMLHIIKIGGNIINDEGKLLSFLEKFAAIEGKKILIHGGGKLATEMAEQLKIRQHWNEGRRVTDAKTLKIVTMVYAGYINKNIVARLQAKYCNAIGICGADGNLIQAHKREHATIDYGYVGDVDHVNVEFLLKLLEQDMTVVFAPITHDKAGQLLNTNADTIAQEIAVALASHFEVGLIYSFEKSGVLLDLENPDSVIPRISPVYYSELRKQEKIAHGMIPKLDNAFAALNSGVKKVMIGNAADLDRLIAGTAGTTLTHE
jgi:acetylglutamate kinase